MNAAADGRRAPPIIKVGHAVIQPDISDMSILPLRYSADVGSLKIFGLRSSLREILSWMLLNMGGVEQLT